MFGANERLIRPLVRRGIPVKTIRAKVLPQIRREQAGPLPDRGM